jgi:hypothetical protein
MIASIERRTERKQKCKHDSGAWEWRDCPKKGHEVECYIAECESCGYLLADCEEQERSGK